MKAMNAKTRWADLESRIADEMLRCVALRSAAGDRERAKEPVQAEKVVSEYLNSLDKLAGMFRELQATARLIDSETDAMSRERTIQN